MAQRRTIDLPKPLMDHVKKRLNAEQFEALCANPAIAIDIIAVRQHCIHDLTVAGRVESIAINETDGPLREGVLRRVEEIRAEQLKAHCALMDIVIRCAGGVLSGVPVRDDSAAIVSKSEHDDEKELMH